MCENLADVERWRAEAQPVALVTVVETWGSAPRQAAAKMGLTADEEIAGGPMESA
jgi:xanthine/CO dehydrogenase XdhC/CoxF family maturation factor